MKTETERLVELMDMISFDRVREAFISRSKTENNRVDKSRLWMSEHGYEEVVADDGRLLTDDGREIVFAHKKKWALVPEEWEKRRSLALDEARYEKENAETKSVAGTESLSILTCPRCGDSFQKTHVCPSCAAGRAGYFFRYNCPCGVEFVSKDDLSVTGVANG